MSSSANWRLTAHIGTYGRVDVAPMQAAGFGKNGRVYE